MGTTEYPLPTGQSGLLTLTMSDMFKVESPFEPTGDQPQAIEKIVENLRAGVPYQTLLGVTGSGKTFTMAKVIEAVNRPTLVISHNKTLAAQLYNEFKRFFPNNAAEYFVSYYDYYQPEAYIPHKDLYIEKDCSINEEIDRMKHAATRSLFERRDVVVVASVSCIYGLGSPDAYYGMTIGLKRGMEIDRQELLGRLSEIQYTRNDYDFHRGTFRVRGDVVEIYASHMEDAAVRVEFWGDEIEDLLIIDPLTGSVEEELEEVKIYPATHYVTPQVRLKRAIASIKAELEDRVKELKRAGKETEAERLWRRTNFDLEMLQNIGYCKGIENYSRHLSGRAPGEPPPTLVEYLPEDALIIIDESHVTIPQLRGMYRGDRSRKENLVEYGFRLPSALDNRPLTFEEFESFNYQVLFVSATPGRYELEKSGPYVVEQLIRPTGLMDPEVEVVPARFQVDHLLGEIRKRIEMGDRVLVTTLTKRMAEDLCDYYMDLGIKVCYLHSEVNTIERTAIIRDLRQGKYDVLIGVNLLREGLDIPEVSLVAILDADQEGFLRSHTSLIQTIGRAARNIRGKAILYADRITDSIKAAVEETNRRRRIQKEYNETHGITPQSIEKMIDEGLTAPYEADYYTVPLAAEEVASYTDVKRIEERIEKLKRMMQKAAQEMAYEQAAVYRDEMRALEKRLVEILEEAYATAEGSEE